MNDNLTITEPQNLPQQFNQYSNSTIQRCPHDAENPYAQISRALIRDQSISPNCRWLIIYLLSNKDGWKISTAQVAKHVKEFLGRDNVWKIFDEAIEAGYILREENKNGNLKNGYRYYVSESPKFKKCFRRTESQCTEAQGTENTEHKEEYPSKEKQKKYIPSANAERLKEFLVNIIKKDKPDFSASTNSWPKIFDDLLKVRTYEQICAVIKFMLTHDFWKSNVVSPSSIKKNLDRIEIQMQSSTRQPSQVTNKEWCELISKKLKPEQFEILSKHVEIRKSMKEQPYIVSFDEKGFKEQVISCLLKCSINIDLNGLN